MNDKTIYELVQLLKHEKEAKDEMFKHFSRQIKAANERAEKAEHEVNEVCHSFRDQVASLQKGVDMRDEAIKALREENGSLQDLLDKSLI